MPLRSGLFKAIRIDGDTATAVDLALLIDSIEVRFQRFAPASSSQDATGRLQKVLPTEDGVEFMPMRILSGSDSVAGDLWRPGQVSGEFEHPFDEQPLGIEMFEAVWNGGDSSAQVLRLTGEDNVEHLLFISGQAPETYDNTLWISSVVPAGFCAGEEAISFSFFEATSFQRLLLQDSM